MNDSTEKRHHLLAQLEDIRRRLKALDEKAEARGRPEGDLLRRVLDASPSLIFLVAPGGRLLMVNRSFAELFHATPEVMVGQEREWFREKGFGGEKDFDEFHAERLAAAQSGEARFSPELSLTSPDGTQRWFQATWIPFPLPDGRNGVLGVAQEITHRKEVESALRQSEERYRILAENATDLIIYHDVEGTLKYVSPASLWLMGYEPEELQGLPVFNFFHPDDLDDAMSSFSRTLTEPEDQYVENRVRHKNGRYVWLGTTARTVRGDDGRPAGVVTVSRDISDRKRTEMELARHKAGLEVLVAERTTQLTRRNLELENLFRIVQAARESSKLDDFFGVVHESLAGLVPAVNFFIGLYDREANRITFPYFVDEKDDRFEIVSVTDSGSLSAEVIKTRFPLRLGAQDLSARYPKERRPWGTVSQSWLGVPLIMGGEPIGVMGVQDYDRPDLYTDDDVRTLVLFSQPIAMAIERIRADQALRDNEERFRFLSEASNEAIFLSREGVVFEANQAAERMFGYTWEKLAGLSFLLLVSPEDRLMLPEIGNTERAEPYQVMALSRDGRLFPVEIKSQMAPYKNGRIRVTAIRDLTRQKEAEAELLEYQERLRRLGSEQVLAEERERRRIAADLHDHIGGSLALLKMRISALYKKTRSNSLRAMLEEFMAQADLVIQATRSLTVQLSPPMLHEMGLGPALEWLAESLAADHQIRVEFDASEPGPELREDLLILLYRSTRELVLNAIKHAEAADIKIRLVWSPDWVFIEVKDDGRGFDSPSLGLLFDWTLGFGLFSVQERLSAMGGRLEISSLPGRGTRATILAPRK